MFVVALVFQDFGENINRYWGCLVLTNEEEWLFCWWVGWSNEDKCEARLNLTWLN